jgi:hypothetical protein
LLGSLTRFPIFLPPLLASVVFDDAGDLLVLAKQSGGRGQIVSLYPNEFFNATAQTVLYNGPLNLNHGLVIRSPFVYASSDTAVYRWNYTAGQRAVLGSDPQLVIEGIPGVSFCFSHLLRHVG